MAKYLDKSGVTYLWNKIKGLFTDQSLNTKNKTYAGAINEINTKVGNLTGAFLWKGKFDTLPAVTNYEAGNVVGVGKKEYVLTVTGGTKFWEEFGDEGSYLLKTTAEETYLKKTDGEVKTANLADNAVTENKLNDDLRSKVNDNVKTITQTLTDTQKAKARQNIDVLEVTQQDIDNLPGGGLNPISDNTTPEVQNIETLLGFDVNGNISKTKTIDADHLATGSVTAIKIGDGNIIYQHLDEGLKATIRYQNGLIICNLDTSIPSEWWYVIEVTENPPVQDLYPIHYIDEYGNIFPLEKVLAGEDDSQKILQFTSLYSDSEPSDVIDLSATYISATKVTVNAPEGDICKISISTGEEAVSDSVNNIVNNTVAGITPLIVTPGMSITQDEFNKCFQLIDNKICRIIFPIYLKRIENYIATLSPILSVSVQEYTDSSNFILSLGAVNYGFTDAGVVNSPNIGHLTASNGTFVFDNFSFSRGSVTNALGLLSGGYNNFVYRNDDLISGYVSTKPLPLASYAQYLWNVSKNILWEKLPWISETALEAVKANLQAKFPDADTANIKQVYKQVRLNIDNPIAVGDDVSQYTAVITGVGLSSLKLYIL